MNTDKKPLKIILIMMYIQRYEIFLVTLQIETDGNSKEEQNRPVA